MYDRRGIPKSLRVQLKKSPRENDTMVLPNINSRNNRDKVNMAFG